MNYIGNGENPIVSKQERKIKELETNNATFEALACKWLDTKQTQSVADTMILNKGALEKHIFPMFEKRLFVSIRMIEWMQYLNAFSLNKRFMSKLSVCM